MSFKDKFNAELNGILQKRDDVAKMFSIELHSAVLKATPVKHGDMKKAWDWSLVGEGHYRSSNNIEYAITIDEGRRNVHGKMQGSEQLPDGFQPIIEREEENLEKMLKDIK